jgi:phytoene synthase
LSAHEASTAEQVVRARAANFYWGLRLTPEPRRSQIYAIYAWMRRGDDIVDGDAPGCEQIAQRRAALDEFRALTTLAVATPEGASVCAQREPHVGWWPAFAGAVRAHGLGAGVVAPTLAGLAEDLDHTGYATLEALEGYCAKVASTAGLACVRVWGLAPGADRARAEGLALRMGLAFQLTNIVRDVGEDARLGRVYVPREMLARAGLDAPGLLAWRDAGACARVIAELGAAAQRHYEAGAPLMQLLARDARPTLWAMARIYQGVLRACLADPRRCVTGPRPGLTRAGKLAIAGRAAVWAMATGGGGA